MVIEIKDQDYTILEGELNSEYEVIIQQFINKSTKEKLPKIDFQSQISCGTIPLNKDCDDENGEQNEEEGEGYYGGPISSLEETSFFSPV